MIYLTAFLILAAAAGFLLLAPLNRNRESLVEALIFCFPVGSGIAAVMIFCLNQALDLPITRTAVFTVLCAELLAALGIMLLNHSRRRFETLPELTALESPSRHRSLLTAVALTRLPGSETTWILIIFFSVFLSAVVNPSFYFDSFHYHLPIPRDIFLNHSIPKWADPTLLGGMNALPPLQWILYAMSYVVAGREILLIPGTVAPFFGALCFLLMYRISKQLKHPEYMAVGALLLFLSEYQLGLRILVENNDIVFSFYCLGSIYCLVRFHAEEGRTHLFLGAVLIALACWTKTLGFLFMFTMVLAFLLVPLLNTLGRPRSFPRTLWNAVEFSMVAFLLILPFLLRNFLLWGNPLYPGFASLLGGYLIDEWSIRYPLAFMSPFSFIYPFCIQTVFGILKAGLIPLIFFFSYLASVEWSKNPLDLFLTLASSGYLVILLLVGANSPHLELCRYLMPAHLVFCTLAGPRFLHFIEASKRPSTWVSIPLGLFLGYHIILQLIFQLFFKFEQHAFVSVYLLLLLVTASLTFFTTNPPLQRIFHRFWPSGRVRAMVLIGACLSFFGVYQCTPDSTMPVLAETSGIRSGSMALPALLTIRLVALEMTLLVAAVSLIGLVWSLTKTGLLHRVKNRSLTSKGCFLAFLVVLYAFPSMRSVTDALVQNQTSLGVENYKRFLGPEVEWMRAHLTPEDRVLTFVSWRYFIPAGVVRPDNPLLKELYSPEITLDQSVSLLRGLGVSCIYLNDSWTRPMARRYPLVDQFYESVLVKSLDQSSFFSKVFEYYDSKKDGFTRIYRLMM